MESRHMDVLEMDAASHTGVDDVRQINDSVRYAPASARYKVYIIDEVHMLSTAAFNAFLKTLEEPPEHAKFVFATTEIRKVPVTVLSRCQRFDLRRVEADVLMAHLSNIAAKEGVEVEPEALGIIARAAEGSVRDSLSLFDQAIAHAAGIVRADAVRQMLGLADRTRVIDLFESLARGDIASAFDEFRAQYDVGADPIVVLSDLAEFVNFVTRVKIVPATADNVAFGETERRARARIRRKALDAGAVADVADAAQGHRRGADRDAAGGGRRNGAGAHRLCRRPADAGRSDQDARAERRRIAGRLRRRGAVTRRARLRPVSSMSRRRRCATPRRPRSGAEASARPQMVAPSAGAAVRARRCGITSFPQLVALAGEKRDLLTKAALEADMRLVRIEDGRLEVALERNAARGAGQRPLAQAGTMDRAALDRDRLQRGRPADAALAERAGEERARARRGGRSARAGGAGAISRRQGRRGAQACRRAAGIRC